MLRGLRLRAGLKFFLIAALMVWVLFSVSERQQVYGANGDAEASLSMPVEYVNYTINWVNGSLWAKIDGNYPIYNSGFDVLPMVYPTPPGTTNISLKLDGALVSWSNYTEVYPEELHHTGIGDWSMIYAVLDDVSDFFVLEIHYEHPVQVINGSYMFLYDLNIKDYLSPSANKSIAYFTVTMDVNFTDLDVQTIALDESLNPINYTVINGNPSEIVVQMVSEHGKPLLGDLLFSFKAVAPQGNSSQQVSWVGYAVATAFGMIVAVIGITLVAVFGYLFFKRSRKRGEGKREALSRSFLNRRGMFL